MSKARTLTVLAAAAAAVAATTVAAPAAHATTFRAQQVIGLYAPVPSGWITVSQNQPTNSKVIEYLGGAPYAATVTALPNQSAPANWVLVNVAYTDATATLEYLGSAPTGATAAMDVGCVTAVGRVYGYAVPAGWTITGTYSSSTCTWQTLRH